MMLFRRSMRKNRSKSKWLVDFSIADDTMNLKGIKALRKEVAALRRFQPKAKDLEALAKRLGRKKTDRGKEPTYVSEKFPDLRPLSIPNHKGRDLATGTKNSILNQLEDDLLEWEDSLDHDDNTDDT